MMGSTHDREASWQSRCGWAAAVAASVGVVAAGQWLGRTAGSTRAERDATLSGDERGCRVMNRPGFTGGLGA